MNHLEEGFENKSEHCGKQDSMKRKLVSIITPCYNGEKYLHSFLESILCQKYPAIELIFVDDGSTDKTEDIVKSFDAKFREKGIAFYYLHTEGNRGAAAAINIGLQHYHGDYMMWVDADDILLPENIEDKVKYLEENPEKDFVFCQMVSVNEDDLSTPTYLWKREILGEDDPLIEDLLSERNIVYGQGVILVRQTAFAKAIPTNTIYESRQGQNLQLLLPLAYSCKCGYIDKVLFKYVVHEDSHAHMKRTYEEQISRQREFIMLIRETLHNIPKMTEKDEERLMSIAEQTMLGHALGFSLQYGRFYQYYKIRREMQEKGLSVKRNLKPFFYYGRKVKRWIMCLNKKK